MAVTGAGAQVSAPSTRRFRYRDGAWGDGCRLAYFAGGTCAISASGRCTLASSAAINNQSLHIGNVWAKLNWQAVVPAKTASSDEVGNRPEGNRPRGYRFV
jgi:hypothetical protein